MNSEPETCYCSLWRTAPETLRKQGVPEGSCGICSVCGNPGHTRAHPSAPVTDAWCDHCYEVLSSAPTPWLERVVPIFIVLLAIAVAIGFGRRLFS